MNLLMRKPHISEKKTVYVPPRVEQHNVNDFLCVRCSNVPHTLYFLLAFLSITRCRLTSRPLMFRYAIRDSDSSSYDRVDFYNRRPPTAADLLRGVAQARGWVVGLGLPDEARAGRLLLKDYTSGKLTYCERPPGYEQDSLIAETQPVAAPAFGRDEQSSAGKAISQPERLLPFHWEKGKMAGLHWQDAVRD